MRVSKDGRSRAVLASLIIPPTRRRPTPSSSTARSSSMTRAPAQALAVRDGKIAAIGSSAEHPRAGRPGHPRHRSRRPHRHPRPDRFPHPRHPRRADLHHRGALDRRPHAGRGARPHPRRGGDRAEGLVARRCRRLDRAAVRRGPPADARPRSPPPRPIITSTSSSSTAACCSTPAATRRSASPRDPELAARAHGRARRRRPADRLAHRRQPRHQRSVQSVAAADLRAEGRGHARVLPRAQRGRADRRDRSRRLQSRRSPTISRCSRSGASTG